MSNVDKRYILVDYAKELKVVKRFESIEEASNFFGFQNNDEIERMVKSREYFSGTKIKILVDDGLLDSPEDVEETQRNAELCNYIRKELKKVVREYGLSLTLVSKFLGIHRNVIEGFLFDKIETLSKKRTDLISERFEDLLCFVEECTFYNLRIKKSFEFLNLFLSEEKIYKRIKKHKSYLRDLVEKEKRINSVEIGKSLLEQLESSVSSEMEGCKR